MKGRTMSALNPSSNARLDILSLLDLTTALTPAWTAPDSSINPADMSKLVTLYSLHFMGHEIFSFVG